MQALSPSTTVAKPSDPRPDCPLCPRLKKFRDENRDKYPDFHNAPVPAFGSLNARLLVVGLAPGLKGANWSGRPFTGDYAGDTLYPALQRFSFAEGHYDASPDDGLRMVDCRITNAVRCVPPQNKPVGEEINQCRDFLVEELKAMPRLRVILCLGTISHQSTLRALGAKVSQHKFGHGEHFSITPPWQDHPITLLDSYHCSRYNTNTGRLTEAMFNDVVAKAKQLIEAS